MCYNKYVCMFSDLGYPGGVRLNCFFNYWHLFTSRLDYGRIWLTSVVAYIAIENVSPVPFSEDFHGMNPNLNPNLIEIEATVPSTSTSYGSYLWNHFAIDHSGWWSRWRALSEHKQNWSPIGDIIRCRNDITPISHVINSDFSPQGTFFRLKKTKALDTNLLPEMLFVAGWFDTSTGSSIMAVEDLRGSSQAYLIIGPWNHAGTQVKLIYIYIFMID